MKQGRKINWLKTMILVLLACGVAGLGLTLALFFGNAAPTYASATLVFSFDGGIVSGLIGGTSEHSFPSALLLGLPYPTGCCAHRPRGKLSTRVSPVISLLKTFLPVPIAHSVTGRNKTWTSVRNLKTRFSPEK